MNFRSDELDRMAAVLLAKTESFSELVAIAGLDPTRDLVGVDLRNVNFRNDDLDGFNFARANLSGANFSKSRGLHPSMFEGAAWDDSTIWPLGFRPEDGEGEPPWFDARGTDEYGAWVSVSVTAMDKQRVSQRLRWCPRVGL